MKTVRIKLITFCAEEGYGPPLSLAKTLPGANCRSDHELLISKFKPKLKAKKKSSNPIAFDLDNITENYKVNTCNRFHILMHKELEKVEPNCLWEDIKHAISKKALDNVPKRQITKKSQ